MPWYYIEVKSGGGHQCTTSRWAWREKSVPIKTSDDIQNFVADEGMTDEYFGGDSAIFTVKKVTKIPTKVRLNMIRGCEAQVKRVTRLLQILDHTPTHPPQCPYEAPVMRDQVWSLGTRCDLSEGHRGKHVAEKRRNREKYGER